MNIFAHTAVSFAVSALLWVAFKKVQMSVACFLAGILIDLDHVFDYLMNSELMEKFRYLRHPRKFFRFLSSGYTKHESTYVSYKLLHSMELLIVVPFFYGFGIWNSAATGIVIGFTVHLIMDSVPIRHLGLVSLIYKLYNKFPKGSEVIKRTLVKSGIDVDECQLCGARGDMVIYQNKSVMGFARRNSDKVMVLCPDCRERIRNQ